MKQKILIVDDNYKERKEYVTALSKDFLCIEAENGAEGLAKALETKPDLIITDACMPEIDGFTLCRLIKQTPEVTKTPVLICTSIKTNVADEISGLEIGAADYLMKPVNPGVLLARVKSHLRLKTDLQPKNLIEISGMNIDLSGRTVYVGDKPVNLARKEFDILVALASAKGHIVSTNTMLENIWGYNIADYNDPHTVKTQICTLKKKLGKKIASHIITITGYGYKFD